MSKKTFNFYNAQSEERKNLCLSNSSILNENLRSALPTFTFRSQNKRKLENDGKKNI